jgi:hypothetical protein
MEFDDHLDAFVKEFGLGNEHPDFSWVTYSDPQDGNFGPPPRPGIEDAANPTSLEHTEDEYDELQLDASDLADILEFEQTAKAGLPRASTDTSHSVPSSSRPAVDPKQHSLSQLPHRPPYNGRTGGVRLVPLTSLRSSLLSLRTDIIWCLTHFHQLTCIEVYSPFGFSTPCRALALMQSVFSARCQRTSQD